MPRPADAKARSRNGRVGQNFGIGHEGTGLNQKAEQQRSSHPGSLGKGGVGLETNRVKAPTGLLPLDS